MTAADAHELRSEGWLGDELGNPNPVLPEQQDSLPEWSKGVDSSSTSASCVGSNPTAVIFCGMAQTATAATHPQPNTSQFSCVVRIPLLVFL